MSDDDGGYGGQKQSVDVGSGDFATNPIYGDKPQSYATSVDDDQQQYGMNNVDEPQEYQNNVNNDEEDDYENNDDEQQPMQQQEQQYGGDQQQYGNDNNDNMMNDTQQQPPQPPPYSEDAPAPPPAYADDTNNAGGDNTGYDYNQEPEDVVAQMNADNEAGGGDDEIDYGVTAPKTEDTDDSSKSGSGFMGNFFIRTLWTATALLFASMLSFAIFFQSNVGIFAAGYGLSGFGAIMLFLGALLAIVISIAIKKGIEVPAINILVLVAMGFYVVGGLFYFIGGCAVAYAWNDTFDGSIATSFAGIFFTEQTYVGAHAIVAGIDLWKQILNNKKWRELIYLFTFLFLAVIDFFAYAVISTDFPGKPAGAQFLAAMYFFSAIPLIIYLLLIIIPVLKAKLGKPLVLIILSIAFWGCVVMVLIAYFVWVGDFNAASGSAYFVGVGFFVLLMGTAIALDMWLDHFIPGFKPSDNDDAGAAVPTTSPDSQDSDN